MARYPNNENYILPIEFLECKEYHIFNVSFSYIFKIFVQFYFHSVVCVPLEWLGS